MKRLTLSFILFFNTLVAFTQCPVPTVSSWHFTDSANVDIAFYTDDNAVEYEIIFSCLISHNQPAPISNVADTLLGSSTPGLNIFQYNVSELMDELPFSNFTSANYFFKVELKTMCTDQEWSEASVFYVSYMSMLNDPDFSCNGELIIPIQYLADGAGFLVSVPLEIEESEIPEFVENLSVLVDLTHTYNGDISMKLTSPGGLEASLINFPNGLGNTDGMSFNFTDESVNQPSPVMLSGEVAPYEPLSIFNGEVASGTWTLEITDNLGADFGFVFGVCLNLNTSPCLSGFSGNTYYDLNSNGIQENDEPVFDFALIENETNSSTFFSNAEGHYSRCAEPGSIELSIQNSPSYYLPEPATINYELIEGNFPDSLDFALTPIPGINDLAVDIWNSGPDRPGFSNTYVVQYENLGTECTENVSINIFIDSLLEITGLIGANGVINENTITVNIGTLCPMESGSFLIQQYLDETATLGTLLTSSAAISPSEIDQNLSDNTASLDAFVVGSYDPNDKQVSSAIIGEEFLNNGENLKYLVRFQNTGTFLAENVVITDTIDENLDLSTFNLINTSHDMDITIDGRVLHFNFNEIMLPDSASDQEGSNGYVRYSIAPSANLVEGNLIENTAYIFFDFNEPIVTNTVQTLIDFSSGLTEPVLDANIFPNPTRDEIWIAWPQNSSVSQITLTDISGKQVLQQTISQSLSGTNLSLQNLSNGVYVVHFISNQKIRPHRVMKY